MGFWICSQKLYAISSKRTFAIRDFVVSNDSNVPTQRTINGEINPSLTIAPGETQLWRLANIGSETFYNIVLPGHVFHVIAEDGHARVASLGFESARFFLPENDMRYQLLADLLGHILSQHSLITKDVWSALSLPWRQ